GGAGSIEISSVSENGPSSAAIGNIKTIIPSSAAMRIIAPPKTTERKKPPASTRGQPNAYGIAINKTNRIVINKEKPFVGHGLLGSKTAAISTIPGESRDAPTLNNTIR